MPLTALWPGFFGLARHFMAASAGCKEGESMSPPAWANFRSARLFVPAWHPAVDGARAPGPPAGLPGPGFKRRAADATSIGLDDPPAIRPPRMLRLRTTECHLGTV